MFQQKSYRHLYLRQNRASHETKDAVGEKDRDTDSKRCCRAGVVSSGQSGTVQCSRMRVYRIKTVH